MNAFYNLVGHETVPTTIEEWRFPQDRYVGLDQIGDQRISTVFLGVSHQSLRPGPPLLFETMIFGGPFEGYEARYSTWEEAELGHKRIVAALMGPISVPVADPKGD